MSLEQAEEARLDLRTGGEDGGTLHQVLELAQVPGPGILLEQLAGPRREGRRRPRIPDAREAGGLSPSGLPSRLGPRFPPRTTHAWQNPATSLWPHRQHYGRMGQASLAGVVDHAVGAGGVDREA